MEVLVVLWEVLVVLVGKRVTPGLECKDLRGNTSRNDSVVCIEVHFHELEVSAESCILGGEEWEDAITPGLTEMIKPGPLALLSSSCPPGLDFGSVFLDPRWRSMEQKLWGPLRGSMWVKYDSRMCLRPAAPTSSQPSAVQVQSL